MKKLLYLILLVGAAALTQPASAQQVLPGQQGVWVVAGDELGDNIRYNLFRKTPATDWQLLTILRKPASSAEIKARMLAVWKQGFVQNRELTDFELRYVWKQVKSDRADSLAYYASQFAVMQGVGLAFLDATATKDIEYTYKVVKVVSGKNTAEKEFARVRFPGQAKDVAFVLKSKKALAEGINLVYKFPTVTQLAGIRVYRGYYQRTGFELINPDLFFNIGKDSAQLTVSDKTAAPKVAYTYYLEPFDAAGNTSKPTGQASLYNVQKNAIAPSVNRINAQSDENKKAIRLSWRLKNYSDVVSIEVFKASNYNGPYLRTASLQPQDTVYLDYKVKPVETYYYSVVLNGMFETSIQSARVPGMLKASELNVTPVNNFTLSQQSNNIVTLEWDRSKADARSYYLYRATGFNQPLKQIKVISTDSSHIRITDTLPAGTESRLYQYAVKDVNTSYAMGPFSPRRNAMVYGINSLPIPDRLEMLKLSEHKIRLIWQNLEQTNTVAGYVLYRREAVGADNPANPFKEIARLGRAVNQWTDSSLVAGKTYVYGVKSVGYTTKNLSAISPLVQFTAVLEAVPQADNIRVYPSEGKVVLSWQNPMGIALKSTEIFRAEKGGKPIRIVTLASTIETYEDKQVAAGKTYYYLLQTTDKRGVASPLTAPLGIVSE